MAHLRKRKVGKLIAAMGVVSLLLSNASASQVTQQASNSLQAMTTAEIQAQSESLLQVDAFQSVVNQALSEVLVKNKQKGSINIDELQEKANSSSLSDKQLNDELYLQLQSIVSQRSDLKQGVKSFDCVIGSKNCMYTNRMNLIQGKMAHGAQKKLINSLAQKSNKKQMVQHKLNLPKVNSANLVQQKNIVGLNNNSKSIAKKPLNKLNLQHKAQISTSSSSKRDSYLNRKQKELMKDIKNPIDDIEKQLAKTLKNKVTDTENTQDYAKELMKSSKEQFNTIFNGMESYQKEDRHVDVHEEKAKMGGGHEIQEAERKPAVNYDVRKQKPTMGNQGVVNLQHDQDVNIDSSSLEKDQRPIDKTNLMTEVEKHHHHHKQTKESEKMEKAQSLVDASSTKKENNKKLGELIKKHIDCPKCKSCPSCFCTAQNVSPLEELATHSNELTFQSADDKPEDIRLQILPQDMRDFVTKDVQVLNSERIIGYNTYNNILEQENGQQKAKDIDNNSDFYNVTVNFVMKRKPSAKTQNTPKELPIQVYESSLAEVEKQQQKQAYERAEQDEDNSEPKVIMPSELKIPQQQQDQKSIHQILQESRISKDDDQTAVQTQESNEIAPQANELVSVQNQEQQRVVDTIQQQLQNLPLDLNNAQIAAQIQSLTPEEAMQIAAEAQQENKPANVINLQLNDEQDHFNQTALTQANKAEAGFDPQELSSLDTLSNETKNIEQSFTDYIVPEQEKSMVESIFSQKIEKADSTNSTSLASNNTNNTQQLVERSHPSASRQEEHFKFLNRVHQRAQEVLANEAKGVKEPLTTNKLTEKMYSQAKLEKGETAKVKKGEESGNLGQQKSEQEQEQQDEQATSSDVEQLDDYSDETQQSQPEISTAQKKVVKTSKKAQAKKKALAKKKANAKRKTIAKRKKAKTIKKKATQAKDAVEDQFTKPKKKKSSKPANMSKLDKAIWKAKKLEKKLEQLQKENEEDALRSQKAAMTKQQSKSLKQVFDEIQFMKHEEAKAKSNHDEDLLARNTLLKKIIKFNEKFPKLHIDLDADLPSKVGSTQSAKEKAKALGNKKLKDPFGSQETSSRPGKKVDKEAEQKKQSKDAELERAHHEKIKKEIAAIFAGKNQLTRAEKEKYNDPFYVHDLFKPDHVESISKRVKKQKGQLDPHKLFQGKTKDQKLLKKMLAGTKAKAQIHNMFKGKHHIAQTSQSGNIDELNEAGDFHEDPNQQNNLENTENTTFTHDEVLDMEEQTLQKKIGIDLKVLAKIEGEKHPDEPKFHYKIIKEADAEAQQTQQVPESLVQESSDPKNADEFVQSTSQNILEIREVNQTNNSQQLSQAQTEQKVLKDMSELQKQFEENAKQKEQIKTQKDRAADLKKQLLQKTEAEKEKRQMLMQKAQAMAQADLVAKHALRKATEQAALDKEQHALNLQKQVEEEAKALAEKQKMLENHKKEVAKAKQMVQKAQREETDVQGRLEKEEKFRKELEMKEQERAQQEIKKTEEIQKQHEQRMEKLVKQQIDLQKKKKMILQEQEDQKKKLLLELERVNKVKQELVKASGPENGENLDVSDQQSLVENLNLLSQQELIIQQAIDKVKLAEEQGEKKGLEEAKKLIKKQANQSLEESEADMQHLQDKFQTSSSKVSNIINNFHKVHSDLQQLKSEYLQQLEYSSNSTSNSTSLADTKDQSASDEEAQLSSKLIQIEQSNLQLKMQSKKRQMKQIVSSLDQIKEEIPDDTDLQTQIMQTRDLGLQDLVQIEMI